MTTHDYANPDRPEVVSAVAHAQRWVLLGVALNLAANVIVRLPSGGAGLALAYLIALGFLAFTMYWVYQLCRALDMTPWLWMIVLIVPLLGFVCLAVLSQRATTFLKQRGIKVGLFGAKT